MTVLSDRTIKEQLAAGRLVIDPLDQADIQPSSVDLHLDRVFRVFRVTRRPYVDVREPMEDLTELISIEDDEPFIVQPGSFVLGSTLESITLPDDIVARVDGKSSLGRLGLLVHATAGFVDPGWMGKLTLELSNQSQMPIALYYRMKISQISFLRMSTPVDRPYGSAGLASKYQGQTGPTPSRIYQDFERGRS
ncbi:MAG: dCTP deaminase [Dehalococcoidia bacterium]